LAPTAATATTAATAPYFHTDETRDMMLLPVAGCFNAAGRKDDT